MTLTIPQRLECAQLLRDNGGGAPAGFAVDVIVRYEADSVRADRAGQKVFRLYRCGKGRSVAAVGQLEDDDVGLDALHVDLRCFGLRGNDLCQQTCIRVVY